jgi:hypothetical protein
VRVHIKDWGSWGITILVGAIEVEVSKERRSIMGTGKRFSGSIQPAEVFDHRKGRYVLMRRGKK